MTMTIVYLMKGNVLGHVEDAVNLTLAFFNVQNTETMTMTIVLLIQRMYLDLWRMQSNLILACLMFRTRTPRP